MAFNIQNTLERVRDYIRDNQRADRAEIGHPKEPPGENTYAAVYMGRVQVASLTLNRTIELHVVTIRYYQRALNENVEDVELNLAKQVELIVGDLLGDYDLGGTIRSVDAGGIYGTALQATFQWADESRYRFAEITLPLIVDDSLTPAQ